MRRIISVISLTDDHDAYPFNDHGVDRDGVPTSQRQSLMRNLGKRCKVTNLPIYRVLKVGEWALKPGERMPEHESFTQFDQLWLEDRGPTAEWRKVRDANIAKRTAKADEATRDLERRLGADIGKQIAGMTQMMAANLNASEKKAVPK